MSSPGFGVLDSGCGKSIIGAETLHEFEQMWKQRGIASPDWIEETNHFRYGNGEKETSRWVVKIPVHLGGRTGTIRAAVVHGTAPLLISRGVLQTLKAVINFDSQEMTIFNDTTPIPLITNSAGQFVVNLMGCSDLAEIELEGMVNNVHMSESMDTVDKDLDVKNDIHLR